MFYDRCRVWLGVILFQLLLQPVCLIAVHVNFFYTFVLCVMNATFSTCKPLHAIPVCCAFLTCRLGTNWYVIHVVFLTKHIMPYGYDITRFYVFHIYAAFLCF
jgi:hypothetical protein